VKAPLLYESVPVAVVTIIGVVLSLLYYPQNILGPPIIIAFISAVFLGWDLHGKKYLKENLAPTFIFLFSLVGFLIVYDINLFFRLPNSLNIFLLLFTIFMPHFVGNLWIFILNELDELNSKSTNLNYDDFDEGEERDAEVVVEPPPVSPKPLIDKIPSFDPEGNYELVDRDNEDDVASALSKAEPNYTAIDGTSVAKETIVEDIRDRRVLLLKNNKGETHFAYIGDLVDRIREGKNTLTAEVTQPRLDDPDSMERFHKQLAYFKLLYKMGFIDGIAYPDAPRLSPLAIRFIRFFTNPNPLDLGFLLTIIKWVVIKPFWWVLTRFKWGEGLQAVFFEVKPFENPAEINAMMMGGPRIF